MAGVSTEQRLHRVCDFCRNDITDPTYTRVLRHTDGPGLFGAQDVAWAWDFHAACFDAMTAAMLVSTMNDVRAQAVTA